MGKKKRGQPDVEEILCRPWCYYCERDFDDQKVLINHQKAKHFKCERCGRRLNTAGGLSVHMSQVHKETLSAVDNALPNRAGLDIEIFGMEGIPEDIIQQHNQRVLIQYHQAEAERKKATGSAGPGGAATGSQPKKPRFESPADLKKRLAEHKAKLAAEQANEGSSGGGTPLGAGAIQSPAAQVANPHYPPQQQFNSAPGNATFSFPPGYGQPPSQAPPFQPAGLSFPPQSTFSPPPFQNQAPYSNPQFSPQMMQPNIPQFHGGLAGGLVTGPHAFGAGSPVQQLGFPHHQQQQGAPPPQPPIHTPPQRSLSGSLPPAPGLPQRPAFGAPHVNHFQMQQMHQGQLPGPPSLPMNPAVPGPIGHQNNFPPQASTAPANGRALPPNNETSLEDLISGASKQADEAAASARKAVETPNVVDKPIDKAADEAVEEKKEKKDKAKSSHLVYSDQETSAEEKMASMPRYAFTPDKAR